MRRKPELSRPYTVEELLGLWLSHELSGTTSRSNPDPDRLYRDANERKTAEAEYAHTRVNETLGRAATPVLRWVLLEHNPEARLPWMPWLRPSEPRAHALKRLSWTRWEACESPPVEVWKWALTALRERQESPDAILKLRAFELA